MKVVATCTCCLPFSAQYRNAQHDEGNPDASEEIHMFVRQKKERKHSHPNVRKRDDRIESGQLMPFQGQSHEEGVDAIEAVAGKQLRVAEHSKTKVHKQRRPVGDVRQGDMRSQLPGALFDQQLSYCAY